MKLWEVTNGYTGESYVRVVVLACDEQTALELAMLRFGTDRRYRDRPQSLKAECVCEDASQEWCSRPSDCGIEPPEANDG